MNRRVNGAVMSYIQISVKLVIALIFTPILVKALGQSGYGLFSIVGAMVAYLYLLDFGLNDSVLRFLVNLKDDKVKRDKLLAQMLGLYAFIGVLVFILGLVLIQLINSVFSVQFSGEEITLLEHMLLVLAGGAAIMLMFNPVGALISSEERFVFLRSMEIVVSLVSTGIILVLLNDDHGALMVVSVMTAGTIVQVFVRIFYAIFFLQARLRYALPDMKEIRRIVLYAAPIFIAMLVEQIYWKLDNLIIGAIIGAAPVAIYAIGVMFNKYFMSFATAISRVMTPEIIRLLDKGANSDQIVDVLIRISRLQAFLLLLILSGLFVFGQRFIVLWLGQDYAISYYVMLAVLFPYAFELIGNVRNIILQVHELYWYRTLIVGVMSLINIPLTIYLLNIYGVIGAAVSTGLGIIIGYVLIAILMKIKLGLDMRRYFVELTRGIFPTCIFICLVGFAMSIVLPQGWWGLLSCAILYTIIYVFAMLMTGVNTVERDFVRKITRNYTKLFRWKR